MSNGATLIVLNDVHVGAKPDIYPGGQGTFVQTGGSATIGGTLHIADGAATSGTVTLSGGSLAALATINQGVLNQTGGTSNLGPISGTGSLSVGGGPGLATVTAKSFSQGGVTVANNGLLSLLIGAARATNNAAVLAVSGNGTLDLANHSLFTNTDPTTIKSYLASAYSSSQDWSGPGLTSSVATANPGKYSLAYASGSDQSAQDAGIPVAPGQTLVQATLAGDANMDGTVNFFDISQVLGYKYNTGQPASYTDGDLNYDGVVDFFDMTVLLSGNYNTGQTYLGAAAAASPALSSQATVPEPSSLSLLALAAGAGLAADLGRSRRSKARRRFTSCPNRLRPREHEDESHEP
jgi:hypothetical protein